MAFVSGATLLALAAPASAGTGGACRLSFDVEFDAAGAIRQVGAGTGMCAGKVGTESVDPSAAPAYLSGSAAPGATACTPMLRGGRLRVLPRRLVGIMEPEHVDLEGSWAAATAAPAAWVSGTADTVSSTMAISGMARFVPRGEGCGGAFMPGTIEIDLVVGEGRPREDSQAAAPAAAAAPAQAPAARRAARKRKAAPKRCRKGRGAKARQRRCRRR
jgi:pyruvate/2-oxoglutarate dehydrogenase complex dihydrolipoamide acyltransferase (E2) component